MRRRSTASSFLIREGRLLLLHRPVSVRSFPDSWSAVSGKLEDDESALEAARREIEEETAYDPSSLRLLATGVPFESVESGREICWRVHPFLWLLHDSADPRLDEENDGFAWVRFADLADHGTVPRLREAFAAMIPGLPGELSAGVRFLHEDRAHGARELATQMLDSLAEALPLLQIWSQWVCGVMQLGGSRPAMAPLAELARRLLQNAGPQDLAIEPPPWSAPLTGRDRVVLAESLAELKIQVDRAAEHAARCGARQLVGHRQVATYSSSSTVREAFRMAAASGDAPRRVILSPAHPSDEGLAQAEALRAFGYEVEIVPDAELAAQLRHCALLLLGADAVFCDGAITNRAGSAALAAAAREVGVPVVVLADEFKRQPRPDDFETEFMNGPSGPHALFERVDAQLIGQILGSEPS